MKNSDVPLRQEQTYDSNEKNQDERKKDKRKKKRNLWPLKVMVIALLLGFCVNFASELVLDGAHLAVAITLTCVILAIGVLFDMVGTASTSCDIEPFLSMASRKVKGAKTAVKLSQKSDVVSSICNDVIGDICGIVSGVCGASIVAYTVHGENLLISVLIYALISTATITLKAVGKTYAVKNANGIIFAVAKVLSIFNKEG